MKEIELYYLIANRNGFEEPLKVSTEAELQADRIELEKKETSSKPMRGRVTYYLVSKRDWDVDHCPLMPVDLS